MEGLKSISLVLLIVVGVSLIVSSIAPQSKRSYLRFLGVAHLMLAGINFSIMYNNTAMALIFGILAILSFIYALYESIVVTRKNLSQMRLRQQAREEALGEVLKVIAEEKPKTKDEDE